MNKILRAGHITWSQVYLHAFQVRFLLPKYRYVKKSPLIKQFLFNVQVYRVHTLYNIER